LPGIKRYPFLVKPKSGYKAAVRQLLEQGGFEALNFEVPPLGNEKP
jgi:hypothetical protein